MNKDSGPLLLANHSVAHRGFTLVELVVTLSVGVILVAIAVPGLTNFRAGRATNSLAHELAESFRLARSEAMKRGVVTTVCPASTSGACDSGTSWQNGWRVAASGASWTVVRYQNGGTKGVKAVSTAATSVTFSPNGLATVSGSASDPTQYEFQPSIDTAKTDAYNNAKYYVCIAKSGRVSVNRYTAGFSCT
jgi:type IV fimbrial biogenesis protein FimT